MSVSTDCASAIANRPHTVTSSRSPTVPISLRVRMDMAALFRRYLRSRAPDYMVRAVSCNQTFDARSDFSCRVSPARAAAMAARGGGDDLFDAGGRRRHQAHRVRPLDRGMEAGHRRAAAADRKRLAG